MFNEAELAWYSRHLLLPELGLRGQERLRSARVLVVGAGGLGCPMLQYLAAAGVGHIGMIDGDRVDISNLHRQVLYTIEEVGQLKVVAAKKRLQALNPHIQIETFPIFLDRDNAIDILSKYDIVADGSDNFATRYLVNDACVLAGKVNVYASVYRFEGQVAVFNYAWPDGQRSAHYRDLYPLPPAAGAVPNCAESGILGVLPGIIGCMQANEVIKIITGIGEPLAAKLLLFDATTMHTQLIGLPRISRHPITSLMDYEAFCTPATTPPVKSLTIEKLQLLQAQGADIQLVDVREPHEKAALDIGGECIPLQHITAMQHRIAPDRMVVIYCQSGQRSQQAIQRLEAMQAYHNLYNLEGGVIAWSQKTAGMHTDKP
ncbi:MAG TPA: molybdopterin-synthase adenylyltransferase MoeB [Saprospiraceae bacterium]|nr:molybdopterin-synthase adenylyltransferase MoeB [Saprospiraceae bacterium]HMP25790.1 molybdopterin-synthase adenylyltransferase MoeB [Saprospiraceae bacterium]